MTERLPADQAARDRAIHDLDRSIFLRAGAGSGKTSVLVGRLIEAVRTGRAELRQIVAITFTEKAAGELRDRVRRELYRTLRAVDGEEAECLRRALGQVDAAHIETIHAFASSLLRERPLEARLDPHFRVLDAVGEQLAFEQAWQDWLWSERDPEARPRVERCLRLGMSLDKLRDLTHRITETRDLDPRQSIAAPPAAATVYDAWRSKLEDLAAASREGGESPQARKLLDQLHGFEGLAPPALEAALTQLQIAPPRSGRRGGEVRRRQDEAWRALKEQQQQYAEAVRSQALADLIVVAYRFVIDDAERRRREGTLTFEDLLIRARDLLVESPSAREYFRQRFKFLLIDEFQDTDPLQAEIVLLLAGQGNATHWREAEVTPGRLFIVGDLKQSIYRFRRADIDIYAEVEELFQRHPQGAAASRVDTLDVNFRSRPDLVAWHNHVFQALIQPDPDFLRAQPAYQPLRAHRQEAGTAVIRLLPSSGVQWQRIKEAREEEARTIVRFIQTVVETDELEVTVRESDGVTPRRPRYRDICLLVRNRTELELYSAALEGQGVPYHLDSGRGFFLQQETREAAALLTALDDPSDEVAVVATLKSAPFSASDVELLEFVQAGGRFRIDAAALPASYNGPLREPYAVLLQLLQRKAKMPLPVFVDHAFRETHLLEIQLARRSSQRAANLHLIVQRAADFAANEVDSLRPFVRWLSTQTRTDLAEAEWPVTEADEDVVRILTIHQAKGLEFPIVVLAKLASAQTPDRTIAVVNRERGTIDFQIGRRDARFQTPHFAEEQARQRRYEAAEERRLLYVAATRARDFLVLPAFFTDRAKGYHDDLEEALPGWMTLDYDVQAPGMDNVHMEELVPMPGTMPPTPRPDVAGTRARWQAAREQALQAGAATHEFITPSRIGEDRLKEPRETAPRRWDETGSGEGRHLGTLIHEALRTAALADLPLSIERGKSLCQERGQSDLADEVERHLRATLGSSLFARVRAADQVERELPLVLVDAERVIEGYVDLAFRDEEGWVIVDYKSTRSPSPEAITAYEGQIRAYVEAFQGTGVPVRSAFLLFTATGESRKVSLQ
ncbi:MAG: UvrD-helicase domain-containing protein [Chloroflexi bacterium]|nr:UvrD-helicase domain-containing protein [Chloroflexota bacterium]